MKECLVDQSKLRWVDWWIWEWIISKLNNWKVGNFTNLSRLLVSMWDDNLADREVADVDGCWHDQLGL